MVEKDVVIKEKVSYAGLGDFKGIYSYAYDFLRSEQFDVIEDNYSEKISGNSKDIEIEWSASRKMTDYFKMSLKIKFRIIGMTEVEAEIDGKKKNMNKFSALNIEMKGTLEKDYNSKWEDTGMQRFFRDLYNKYIIAQRTKEKEEQVISAVQNFKDEMRAFLQLTAKKR